MTRYTLEEIENIAKEKYGEWQHLIDEEPTIFKNFKGKSGNDIVVIISEYGATVGTQRERVPQILEDWDGITFYYLYEYKELEKEFEPNDEMEVHFNKETLQDILNITKDWMNFSHLTPRGV